MAILAILKREIISRIYSRTNSKFYTFENSEIISIFAKIDFT